MSKITAHDPEARSADVVAGNLRRLKAVFPEVFTEGKSISTYSNSFSATRWTNVRRSTVSIGTASVGHANSR